MCTAWSDRLDDALAGLGASPALRQLIREHQSRLCNPDWTPRRLTLSPRVQHLLFCLGVPPDDILAIAQHVSAPPSGELGPPKGEFGASHRKKAPTDPAGVARRARDAERKRQARTANRAAYNERQRLLMRARRARASLLGQLQARESPPDDPPDRIRTNIGARTNTD